jgi:pimeloyl-ACP methyl ester carboxylesterase
MVPIKDVDGGEIGWREAGAGEPVIFLHAMVTSRSGWDPQILALAHRYRCVAWDMPGYGHSRPLLADASMETIIETLLHFVTEILGYESAHFVGLSVGGMMLQHLAVRHPERVRSIAMLDCSPKFGFGGGSSGAEFEAWASGQLDSRPQSQFCEDMVRAIVAPDVPEAAIEASLTAMGRASRAGLDLTTRLIARHDALELLPRIGCPTLVMAGEHDRETPPEYAWEIARRIPGANLTIIPNAGHISNLEAPEAVSARLRVFLEHGL